MRPRSFGVRGCLVVAVLLAAPPAALAGGAGSASSAPQQAPAIADLPPLPELPKIKRREPEAEAVRELDGLLQRLVSEKKDIRDAAVLEIDKVPPSLVPAISARVQDLRESIDRERVPRLLEDARKAAREGKKGKKKDDDDDQGDWLAIVLARPAPKSKDWGDLVRLLAMERMLTAAGDTPAVRELIELRGYFGEMLRIDLARQIDKLKDRAVPALIEAKKHDAAVVRRFAEVALDKLGRTIPGEAVAATDPDVLADVLRAFGYVRDVDAVGVCLSFANHDRRKVREAARQAIAGIGEPGRWQLRDAYQDLTGDKPDKSVPWDVLARRIFHEYDKARVAEVTRLAEDGLAAAKAGKLSDATAAFDKVLAQDPLFERRSEMVSAYFELAKTIPFDKGEERLAMLRKARRLEPATPAADSADPAVARIDAEIAFTEAKLLIAEGRPDRFLVARALELDPSHAGAKELAASFDERAVVVVDKPWKRYWAAGGVGALTLALLAFAALFRRSKPGSPPAPAPPAPPTQPDRAA
jgi:tetratricopeptide (TPR) repeat protein